jgi:hypothetical protein
VRCGHCKEDHDSVAEVKACYGLPEFRHQSDSAWMSADGDPEGYGDPPSITGLSVTVKIDNPGKFPWTMPEGHYAIDGRDGRATDFYRVDRPGGKWEGWTFVKMVVGGKPDTKIKDRNLLLQILEAIESDPARAAQRYGVELGRCSECNIHLTDEVSRALGIGPTCREKKAARVA